MKKRLKTTLYDCCLLAVIGVLVWLPLYALDEGTIGATITPKYSAISVVDGDVTYGSVAWSGTRSTIDEGETQTATNGGSTATFNVRSTQASGGTSWTMATAIGTIDEFVHEFSTTTSPTWEIFDLTPANYKTATTSVPANDSASLDLRVGVPDETTDFAQKTITVTVQAVAD